jgi:hypothetical protein
LCSSDVLFSLGNVNAKYLITYTLVIGEANFQESLKMDSSIVIGWLVLGAFVVSMISFGLGFCAQARINQRRVDELITVIKRPMTNTQTVNLMDD